jgi:hypothetical protein
VSFDSDQIITGTLTCSGAAANRRVFLRGPDTAGIISSVAKQRVLTVGTLAADDCDFRDIEIAGTAAGSTPTRAGDCGNNIGITFPAPKTVYWNLAGTQNITATGWAATSGGSPAVDNHPLAQDTAVFDNTGSAGTVTFNTTINIGTVDMSARTSALTISALSTVDINIYGDWLFGTGVSQNNNSAKVVFCGTSLQTITSNGVSFQIDVVINRKQLASVVLADAISAPNDYIYLYGGQFDTAGYALTASRFRYVGNLGAILMGASTWTLSGTGTTLADFAAGSSLTLNSGTSNIVLSSNSTAARTFAGGVLSYNKLTIGGATGTSTLTISGNNQFAELASTKTVAHTIALGTTVQTFGKWSVTGTAGNVVTLTGTGTSHQLVGACTDGINYLAMGSNRFSANSPAEFYAGTNSTAISTPAAPTYLTAKPADSTRYWVGGTGNWNDTNRWSTSSGGAGGASLPRSHDDVVFDANSNATAYTATVNAITGGNRCKALTIAGPASGNVTLAGSTELFIHDDITLPATGLTRTYTGFIRLSGTGAGKTITTNGVGFAQQWFVNGVGAEWSLGDALTLISSANLNVLNGSFSTAGYNFTGVQINANYPYARSIDLSTSTVSLGSTTALNFGTSESNRANLVFNAGTSQINATANNSGIIGNNQTFYNVSFTSPNTTTSWTLVGSNTFNNLSFAGRTTSGIAPISVEGDQTINGTLTLSAGTDATCRTFVRSNTIGTTRTLTCAAVASLTDIDFRDITIAGAAVSGGNLTGTRLGDCKGNSGITFDAGKTVYYRGSTGNWVGDFWSFTDGGAFDTTAYPLVQDTAVFPSVSYPASGSTVTVNAAANIGTIDMSARTTNTMTLGTGTTSPSIYGNWINGTGVTISGTGTFTFAGRGSQTLTSAGRTFTQSFTIDTPGGSVTLQDAFETNRNSSSALRIDSGTFDANGYNVTLSGATSGVDLDNTSSTRTLAVGSGTWTIAGTTAWDALPSTGLTVTGTGTLKFTSASSKSFSGGNLDYSGITLDQAGAGQLTIAGNNTLANITNTYSATGATTLNFGTTTQRVADFTATGTAGNVLTIQGSNATQPCTLIHTGAGDISLDYVTITGVRAYQI